MAMIQCPECGKEISSSADVCPNCGYGILKARQKQNAKTIWKIAGGIFLFCFIVLAIMMAQSGKSGKSGSGKFDAGDAPEMEKDRAPISEVMDSMLAVMRGTFGNNVRIKEADGAVIASVWIDGVAEDAQRAKSGDKEMLDTWGEVTISLKELAGDMQKYLDAAGYSDVTAVINLQNDLDTSKTLLTVTRSRVILDAVNE